MAWTSITNAAVAAGAAVTTALMTALRDNLIAVLNGETGAPPVRAKANAIETIYSGSGSGVGDTTIFSKTDFADIGMLRYDVNASYRSTLATGNDARLDVRVSANGGSTWSAWTEITPGWEVADNDEVTVAMASGYINLRDGAVTGVGSAPVTTGTGTVLINNTSFASDLNAIEFRIKIDGGNGNGSAGVVMYPVAGVNPIS